MGKVYWLCLIVLLGAAQLLQTGCSEPSVSERKARQQFVAAFKQAQAERDVAAMLELYAWNDVDEETRRVIRFSVSTEIDWPIVRAQIVPLRREEIYRYSHAGEDYVPNLSPTARLHVLYDVPQVVNSTMLIGRNEAGEYRMVLPRMMGASDS